MTFEEMKQEMFAKDPELKKEYDELSPRYEIIYAVVEARGEKGISQRQLAEMTGTKQSSISRFESGDYNPSLSFLQKIAKALDLKLVITLADHKAS